MSAANFPCSICEATFHSPKDLGTHILQQHCEEATPKKVMLFKKEICNILLVVFF